jgi:hypothetical protein
MRPRWQTNAMAVVSGLADPGQFSSIWGNAISSVCRLTWRPGVVTQYYGAYDLPLNKPVCRPGRPAASEADEIPCCVIRPAVAGSEPFAHARSTRFGRISTLLKPGPVGRMPRTCPGVDPRVLGRYALRRRHEFLGNLLRR